MIRLRLCVNDHRNGAFRGLLRAIALADSERLTLESPFADRSLKCEFAGERSFRLGMSHWWRHHGHGTWCGSWCWDTIDVKPDDAADILNFCLSKGYQPTVGSERLWKLIEDGTPLTAVDLLESEVPR